MVTITLENYEENKMFICSFLKMTHYLTQVSELTLFGGIVRDLIVPMSECEPSIISMKTFKEMLTNVGSVVINDIDVLLTGSNTYTQKLSKVKSDICRTGFYHRKNNSEDEKNFAEAKKDYDNSYGIDIKRYTFHDLICDVDINVDFVLVKNHDSPPIDFNVNNLTWSSENGFGLACFQYQVNYFMSKPQQLYEKIAAIKNDIKQKRCKILPSFSKKITGNMKRIEKMRSKGFLIEGLEHAFKTSYKEVAPEDAKCLICFETLEEKEVSITLCGKDHFLHWECGKIWWSEQKFECLVCKVNNVVPKAE